MSGECQVNVKSQSELDIGGRETCLPLSCLISYLAVNPGGHGYTAREVEAAALHHPLVALRAADQHWPLILNNNTISQSSMYREISNIS